MLLIADFLRRAEPLSNSSIFGRKKNGIFWLQQPYIIGNNAVHKIHTNLILKYLNLVFDINHPTYILKFNKLVYN